MDNREELIKEILNLAKGMPIEEVQKFIKMHEASKTLRAGEKESA